MKRKRRVNLPLIEVFLISLAVHAMVLFVLGGITIYRSYVTEAVDFAPPPPEPSPPSQQQEVQLRLDQQQRQTRQPRRVIQARRVGDMNMPAVDVRLPNLDSRVVMTIGGGRTSVTTDLGRGGIGFEGTTVDFIGIRAKGERIVFIIDTSRYMMEDQKGGMRAYEIIKEEMVDIVKNLGPATLFNVILYEYRARVTAFRPELVAATPTHKEAFVRWIEPLNADFSNLGARIGDVYELQAPFPPIGDEIQFEWRAFHAAMEMQVDTVFFVGGSWNERMMRPYPEDYDREAYRRSQGWDEEKQKAWEAAVQRARDWLDRENAERAKRGMEPMVVQFIHTVVRNNLNDSTPAPPDRPREYWELDDLMSHFRRLAIQLYPGEANRPPSFNLILFRGKDEGWTREQENQVRGFVQRNRGTHRVLEGLEAIETVTGRR